MIENEFFILLNKPRRMIYNRLCPTKGMTESEVIDPLDSPNSAEYNHPLSWLAKGKSVRSILIVLATLSSAVLLTIVGFLIGVRAGGFQGEVFVMGDMQVVRVFIAAGFIALATVVEYQFLK